MRKIQYLSPSSIAKFVQDRDDFYVTYLSETRAPRMAQTKAMSIGSSFDAYVKSFLHEQLFGKNYDPKFDLKTLFEAQVEKHNRDWAWEHGQIAFDYYKRSGALTDLMLELQGSIGTPKFEIEIKGVVNGHREGITKKLETGVVLLGKPDVFYINKHNCYVNLDFKVNGWLSKYNTSPMAGYLRIRSGSGHACLTGPHKNCIPMAWNGSIINCGTFLEQLNEDWARQLAIYAWLCGIEVGDEFIAAIDQLVCSNKNNEKYPEVRIAEHRLRVHPDYQWKIFAEAQEIWDIVTSDHIFRELSLEDSKKRCLALDDKAKALADTSDPLFAEMTRS